MREILFRGQVIRNDTMWVEGFYIHVPCGRFCCEEHLIQTIQENGRMGKLFTCYESTIGQYTGLKDKNGKRIFEGDIVRYYERQLDGADVPVIQTVGYDEGGFCVRYYFLNNWLRNAVNGNIQLEGIEVIGNIHDNPELIGGGEDA